MIDVVEGVSEEEKDLFLHLVEACNELGIASFFIGAGARDLIFRYQHGLDVPRATEDADFAVRISSWGEFDRLKSALAKRGFVCDERRQQRMHAPSGRMLDIVPFGGIASDGGEIAWPPHGDTVMSVLGFEESLGAALTFRVSAEPDIIIHVASVAGFVLLKLVAWNERDIFMRGKDASDLRFVLSSYSRVLGARVFEDIGLLEEYEADVDFCAAHLLGKEAGDLASRELKNKLRGVFGNLSKGDAFEQLLLGVNRDALESDYEHNAEMLRIFLAQILG